MQMYIRRARWTTRTPRYPDRIQRAIKSGVREACTAKHVTEHTLRHAFSNHLLQTGTDTRTVQQLLGHTNVSTSMI